MSVPEKLYPMHRGNILTAMKVMLVVTWITFNPTEANPLSTLYVSVLKLNENKVLVPGSLPLRFDLDLARGHANNFLVKNVTQARFDKRRLEQDPFWWGGQEPLASQQVLVSDSTVRSWPTTAFSSPKLFTITSYLKWCLCLLHKLSEVRT